MIGTRRLFTRIRWQLVAWTFFTVGLILLVLGTTVYVALSRSLLNQVDQSLISRSEQAIPLQPGASGRFQGREGYRGGGFYLAIDPDNEVVANPQQVTVDVGTLPMPDARVPVLDTITINGQPARVLVRPLPEGGRLIVGQTLVSEQNALGTLLLILLGGGGVGLLLLLGGAWFLAGRALIPIQKAFQRQQEFVADASHELRTPLTVLQASAELLNEHRDEPLEGNGEMFDDIRHEIGRMVRMTVDLLTLARSDRGDLDLLVGPTDLATLARDVVRRTTPVAQDKGVRLGLVVEGAAPTVEADPDRLQQVLLILLDNAIKHTPAGGQVEVHVQRQSTGAVLDVVDSGEGIAPEHLSRIFDRFYRADAARSSEYEGAGLGLAIARLLVEAHRGNLSLSSTLGVGTRVTVRLPLEGHAASLGDRLGELAAHLAHTPAHQ